MDWATGGYFRVAEDAIKFKFRDVFFYENELTIEDRQRYKRNLRQE